MKTMIKQSLLLITTLILSGCSFMSPVKLEPETGYIIDTVPNVAKSHRHAATLLIMQPDTNPIYNTTRIAFANKPFQISYYSRSHWIEAPADMLAAVLAQTMQKTNHFKSVIAPPFSGLYTYALRTQIKTLQADYTRPMPAMQVTIQAQIVRAGDGRIIAAREFKTAVPLQKYSPFGAVVAANCATSQLLSEMAVWCVRYTH